MPLLDIEGVGQVDVPEGTSQEDLIHIATQASLGRQMDAERARGERVDLLASAVDRTSNFIEPAASTPENPFGLIGSALKPVGKVLQHAGNVGAGLVRDIRLGQWPNFPAASAALS